MPESLEKQPSHESVELKDPPLAAFLAWLIPGLGHLYQGRTAKAGLFFVCIMGIFLYGIYLCGSRELGWGRAVYVVWGKPFGRLPYLCQIGIGLPALPALVQAHRMNSGKKVWAGGFMSPPRDYDRFHDANRDQPSDHELHTGLNRHLELGRVYTMIAGLLNLLAIYDAWGGPVFGETTKKKEEEEPTEEEEDVPADLPS